jgi:hypothetical protein
VAKRTTNPVCIGCGESDISKFYKKKRTMVRGDGSVYTYQGYYSKCKKCVDKYNTLTIHKYSEYYSKYRKENKEKISVKTRAWYVKKKQLWIDIIKNSIDLKCIECGYDKSFAALDFHHIDPSTKDSSIQFNVLLQRAPTPERVRIVFGELEKCVVLCSNCHRELHAVYDFSLIKS